MISLKKNILIVLIISLIFNNIFYSFAGTWYFDWDRFSYRYLGDNGQPAVGCWRWIDDNNDKIAECYRFDDEGLLVYNTKTADGKELNEKGQWVVNGVVQQIYTQLMKPVFNFGILNVDKATTSNTIINAYKSDMKKQIQENNDKNKDKNKGKTPKGSPYAVFSPSETGYVLGKKVSLKAPTAQGIQNTTIHEFTGEESEPKYVEEGEVYLVGRNMKNLVRASNKFKKTEKKVKIYGGEEWDEAMCLSGDGAFVKFNIEKYNYVRMEVAHQNHSSTSEDTHCYLEMSIGNEVVAVFDDFNDGNPELIEEYFDDEDKAVQFKLVIEGSAKSRKVYIRNARARKVKD